MFPLVAVLALLGGLALGWWLANRPVLTLRAERDEARKQAEERGTKLAGAAAEIKGLQTQISEREQSHTRQLDEMNTRFEALAARVLEQAQGQFLARAEQRFAQAEEKSAASLKAALAPVAESLGRYEGEIKKIETAREQAYGSIKEAVENVRTGQEQVRTETARLVGALRASPKARGRWGEQQLKNVLEMAGLAEHVDFATEVSTSTDDGKLRPDVIVRVPGGRQLVIDAKCSMNAFLDACEATDDTVRLAFLEVHARALRTHADQLGRKAYWDQFAGTADYVIMFIPGEQFLSGALEVDAGLWEYAFERKVLLATPTNLVAIARTVAVVWRQEKMAEDAARVAALAKELYGRLAKMGGFVERLGNNLETAVRSFNSFVGSLEGSVMPQGRKFLELSVDPGAKSLPSLEPIETAIREARRDRDISFDDAAE